MKQLLLIIVLFAAAFPAAAQEFKLGKVSEAELKEKVHPADTSAPAALLFKYGKTYFEFNGDRFFLVTEVQARIKIYKKEGYEYANEEVPYYTGGMPVKLYFSDAYTYNLVGNKIEKTKLRSDGEFEEKVNDEYSIKKIVMPNVKEGSVIEYSYTLKTPYFHRIRDWYFQYPIPANFVSYEVVIPVFFEYNRYLSGYLPVDASSPVTRRGGGDAFNEIAVKYTAKGVKALKEESYVNNIRNYTSILKHELAAYKPLNGTHEHFSTTWEAVSKKIYEDDRFGKQLNAKSYYEDDLKALIPENMSTEEKTMRIFNYVKSRMTWNEGEDYLTDKGVSKAYKDKTGNAAEINLMLVSMLRHAGVNANPVLVSTRSNGIALYPNTSAYDYVIAAIKNDKEYILLDATSKFSLPNVVPVRALNWVGRLIREGGISAEVDLMPKANSKDVINLSVSMDNEGKITGRARDQYYDYNALIFRERFIGLSKDSYIEKLESRYKGLEINEYNVTNENELSKPVVEDFSFTHNGVADVIGDKIYFSPMLFFTHTVNPFKEEKREYPIDFTYQHQDKYMINITIPEGYVVESLPKPLILAMEENIGAFKYNIQAQNNQIQLVVSLDINYPIISQQYYTTVRDFFRQMIEKQTEKVVLKKA